MNAIDDRISAALHAAVDDLREQDLRPGAPPMQGRPGRHTARWLAPLLTAAAVAAAVATTFALTGSPSASHQPQHQPAGVSTSATDTTAPSLPPSMARTLLPVSTTVGDATASTLAQPPATPTIADVPLWPFASPAEAEQWKNVDGPNGHSPWHTDAKATALFFATGCLNFHDITEVTSVDVQRTEAVIGVGFDLPSGDKHTASFIRLTRYGDDAGPWEVVGATADGFSIGSPKYGQIVTSPVTVVGHVTGVDENVTVAVRSLDGAVDVSDPIPAGGNNARWTTIAPYSDRQHGVLTVVAWTGGHLTAHERFAATGVNAAS